MAYVQKNNPFPITSCGRRRSPVKNKAKGMDAMLLERIQRAGTKKKGGRTVDNCVKA
jgi:hypothetical protein